MIEVNVTDQFSDLPDGELQHPEPIIGPKKVCPEVGFFRFELPKIAGARNYTWNISGSGITSQIDKNILYLSFNQEAILGDIEVFAYNECAESPSVTISLSFAESDLCSLMDCSREGTFVDNDLLHITGLQVFQDTQLIGSDALLNRENYYRFRSGNSIVLEPYFEIPVGTIFISEIGDCISFTELRSIINH